jgi:hypothetical protein
VVSGLLAVVVAVLVVVCVWLARRLRETRRKLAKIGGQVRAFGERTARAESELAAARDHVVRLDARVAALAGEHGALLAERDELREEQERAATAQGRLEEELAQARAENEATAERLARERERAAAAARETAGAATRANEYRTLLESVDANAASPSGVPGATWPILLATLTRRWAATVGAPPDARDVRTGTVPEQLAQALRRESERLREEVGVDVEVRAGGAVDVDDPVTLLLAATDVLGVLAMVCERVVMALGDGLTLTGEGWSGPTDELELARARAAASGMNVDDLTVDDDRVSVTLRPRATATAWEPSG